MIREEPPGKLLLNIAHAQVIGDSTGVPDGGGGAGVERQGVVVRSESEVYALVKGTVGKTVAIKAESAAADLD